MKDKEAIEFSFKTDTYPTILNAIKDMLMDGFEIEATVYDQRKSGKSKGEWHAITRLKLRAWKVQ